MRLCVLDPVDESPELSHLDPPCDPAPYLPGHEVERVRIRKASAVKQVRDQSRHGFDAFINLCDGAFDEERPGIEVVQALERQNLAFTGASSDFFEPTREAMKLACLGWDIPTPGFAFAADEDAVSQAARTLRFPLIVKHPSSYGSVGLTRRSRVQTPDALHQEARSVIARYASALIEEFIEGREFTVLVAENPDDREEPRVFCPVEFRFPAGETFKHFDLKWINHATLTHGACQDPELVARLEDSSRRMFLSLNGSGYGRCDLRLGRDGVLYMLEINPNCGVFYSPEEPASADAVLLQDLAGHRGFLDGLLRCALERRERNRRRWELRPAGGRDCALCAARDIAEGEIILPTEGGPLRIVSRGYVDRAFGRERKGWFGRNAVPLADDVFILGGERAGDFKPIGHSCDPNAWLVGLDLAARRRIAKGEEITVDCATFCGEGLAPFECRCGARLCRGVIRGSDHLLPLVAERYGDHVSAFVRGKRLSAR
jgi:D-alanine-D-alanine ligase